MTVRSVYETSPIKRTRSTKAEVEARREALLDIIEAGRPMTVRQVFYQATVRGLVEKAESGYAKVQTDLTIMRRAGELPYDWLADNTRWQRKPRTFDSVEDALRSTAAFYRKALWADADSYVEIWLEKDALAGVIYPITSMYDVPLMVARGYASLSFLYSAAEYINTLDVPTFIYHCGDFDPSGVNAGEKIEESWHLTPTSFSSASPSPPNKSRHGPCRRGRPSPAIRGRRTSAKSPSSLMPSSRTNCAQSFRRRSSATCLPINSRC
jgi:hypothetical protein